MWMLVGLLAIAMSWNVRTLIGTGTPGNGDAAVNNPYGLVIGPDAALYFCEIDNHLVRRMDLHSGKVTVVAGNGQQGNTGDGGPALAAALGQPYEVRFDKAGNMFFADMPNHVVRRVDRNGIITTVAGTGHAGFSGDGGPAKSAELRQPHSIAFDRQGRLLICDIGNNRVRRVDLDTGLIDTWLGNGDKGDIPEGAPIKGTSFNGPRAIESDAAGNLYLALREGNAIYKIDPKADRVTRFAGTGEKGFSGDGGPAVRATLNGPKGIALSPDGGLYIADTENHAIRRVDLKSGILTTVTGTGERGDGPNGDPLKCRLSRPHGVCAGSDGTVYVADSEAHRIRALEHVK